MTFAAQIRIITTICVIFSALSGPARADVTVFAAASLRGALDEIAALSNTNVTLSYAGSGTIARQVAQGAPADVVILAHPRWMDWLGEQHAILSDTRKIIAQNALIVIGPKGAKPLNNAKEVLKRLGQNRLAIGQRDSVPAGIYARQWLVHEDLWNDVQNHLAEVENVRLALALVQRGETPLGVVYQSDAIAEPRVDILLNVPENTHEKITYPAALVTKNGHDFITLLQTPRAKNILEQHGFTSSKAQK